MKAWTNKYLYLGHKATFTKKSTHRKLKYKFLTSTGNLMTVVTKVYNFIIIKLKKIYIHHEKQKMQLLPKHLIGPFRYFVGIVSPVVLTLMYNQ